MNGATSLTRNDASHLPEWQVPPIIDHKQYDAPSVFTPDRLLREARRQKALPIESVPVICIFDPDGDVLDYLQATGRAQLHPAWACYHTQLYSFEHVNEYEHGTN